MEIARKLRRERREYMTAKENATITTEWFFHRGVQRGLEIAILELEQGHGTSEEPDAYLRQQQAQEGTPC